MENATSEVTHLEESDISSEAITLGKEIIANGSKKITEDDFTLQGDVINDLVIIGAINVFRHGNYYILEDSGYWADNPEEE